MVKKPPDQNDQIISLLERNNDLLTVLAKAQLSDALEDELGNAKHRKLYELTGKNIAVTKIASQIGVSTGSISRTWQRWERMGILAKEGGQYRRIF